MTIQFMPISKGCGVDGLEAIPRGADATLEVMGRDLTEGKKRAFAVEVGPRLAHVVPAEPRSRIARLLGIKADAPRQVALQFNELSPAIGDPFVVNPARRAA